VVVKADIPATTAAGSTISVPCSVGAAASTHVVTGSGLAEFDVALTPDPPDQDITLGTTTVSGPGSPRGAAGIRPAAPSPCRNPASRNCRDPPESFPGNAILP
jgi:hypothetical protein